MKDSFSSEEKALLKQLVNENYRIIALTREELDPYDLYKRFENCPHKYSVSLQDLSENTIYLNLN